MRKFKLKNGLTVLYEKRLSKSVAIEATIKVGSVNECENNNGISHFLEHMLFEGTKKRKTNREIANEIEKLGGELNAYTANEKTAFYAKVLNKHFDKALSVLSDIIQNPLFEQDSIEKEREVILKEINMVMDEPRFYQWILFQKTLFKKHPIKNPTYGKKEVIINLKRDDILNYYKQYYVPNNMIISVVGNVNNLKSKLENSFSNFKSKKSIKKITFQEPKQIKPIIKKEQKKIFNSYMVLGYKTPIRIQKDSYTLDVIRAILGRGQSGKLFDEIRNKRGLAYEIGVQHEASITMGIFAVYLSTDKKNIPLIKKIILEEFQKLKKINNEELNEAKTFFYRTKIIFRWLIN
jgi:predicted Zn-dependent peptidase